MAGSQELPLHVCPPTAREPCTPMPSIRRRSLLRRRGVDQMAAGPRRRPKDDGASEDAAACGRAGEEAGEHGSGEEARGWQLKTLV
uniref:Uncharacterized protein n=1 Tax=Oryza brachyantha TaxID=4533 RepID=J3N8B4_ORYBR